MGGNAIAGDGWRGLAIAAGIVTIFGAAPMLAPTEAVAQFVCSDTTGTGQGAIAGPNSVACGTAANASGTNSGNTATGTNANASGNDAQNVAAGLNTNASGQGSFNVATGREANASGAGGSGNIATGAFATAKATAARTSQSVPMPTPAAPMTATTPRLASLPTLMATPATTSRSVPRPSPTAVR
jgi:hypothetical protein